MTQFRKKPVVIEAKQYTGTPDSNREIIDWTRDSATPASMDDHYGEGKCLSISTLEGAHWVSPGDWIIKGVKGEFYPCKPDIFAATYEAAAPAATTALPHQQRVLEEKQELDLRIAKLDEFTRRNPTFCTAPQDEQARLLRQLDVMRELSTILRERIDAF